MTECLQRVIDYTENCLRYNVNFKTEVQQYKENRHRKKIESNYAKMLTVIVSGW